MKSEDGSRDAPTAAQPAVPAAQRALALAYGITCHAVFAVAVVLMAVDLWQGLEVSLAPLHGPWALVGDLLLLAQFPLLHSFLVSARGRHWLARLAPRRLAKDLSTTTFALIASLQLVATFGLWSPLGPELWRPHGWAVVPFAIAYGAAWLFLLEALREAYLPVQTGFLGWSSVFRGRRPSFPPFPQRGLFGLLRQPVYLGFALVLWTGAVWTPGRVLMAVGWTLYCVLAPRLKERRYAGWYGEAFDSYRQRVPYMLPRARRRGREQSPPASPENGGAEKGGAEKGGAEKGGAGA